MGLIVYLEKEKEAEIKNCFRLLKWRKWRRVEETNTRRTTATLNDKEEQKIADMGLLPRAQSAGGPHRLNSVQQEEQQKGPLVEKIELPETPWSSQESAEECSVCFEPAQAEADLKSSTLADEMGLSLLKKLGRNWKWWGNRWANGSELEERVCIASYLK